MMIPRMIIEKLDSIHWLTSMTTLLAMGREGACPTGLIASLPFPLSSARTLDILKGSKDGNRVDRGNLGLLGGSKCF